MSDNINVSMNFMYGKVETEAPAVESSPKKQLNLDEMTSVLAFLQSRYARRVAIAARSVIVIKAAALSTHFKRAKFMASVETVIVHLKDTGQKEAVVKLTQLISKPLFSDPNVLFSPWACRGLNKELKESLRLIIHSKDRIVLLNALRKIG